MTEIKEHINTGCFLILLLTFVAPLFTFAQAPLGVKDVNALHLKAAESDAKQDADTDMRRPAPFFMGMGSALAGGTCVGLTEYALRASPSGIPVLGCCALAAAGTSPFLFTLVKHYNTAPHPPIERLIGKHPVYVSAYIDAYGKKMRSRQRIAASAGAAVGCGIIVGWTYVF